MCQNTFKLKSWEARRKSLHETETTYPDQKQ